MSPIINVLPAIGLRTDSALGVISDRKMDYTEPFPVSFLKIGNLGSLRPLVHERGSSMNKGH
jgi:hypothetical protein